MLLDLLVWCDFRRSGESSGAGMSSGGTRTDRPQAMARGGRVLPGCASTDLMYRGAIEADDMPCPLDGWRLERLSLALLESYTVPPVFWRGR